MARRKWCTTWGCCLMAVICWLSTACKDGRVYDHYEHTAVDGWRPTDTLHFQIPPQKKGTYTLEVGLLTTGQYPYRDLSLVMNRKVVAAKEKTQDDKGHQQKVRKGKTTKDYISCRLIDEKGNIRGVRGVSNNTSNFFITQLELNDKDSIYITLRHHMKDTLLTGITAVGIRLYEGTRR